MPKTVEPQPKAKNEPSEFVLIISGTRPSEEIRIDIHRYDEWKVSNRARLIAGLSEFCRQHDLEISQITKIITGGAPGYDDLGFELGSFLGIDRENIYADWIRYKKSGKNNPAGMHRNTRMERRAHGLLAFWDGKSPGTKDMISKIKKSKKPYTVVHVGD